MHNLNRNKYQSLSYIVVVIEMPHFKVHVEEAVDVYMLEQMQVLVLREMASRTYWYIIPYIADTTINLMSIGMH